MAKEPTARALTGFLPVRGGSAPSFRARVLTPAKA